MDRVWDSSIIERASRADEFSLGDVNQLDKDENLAERIAAIVEEWAMESFLVARVRYTKSITLGLV